MIHLNYYYIKKRGLNLSWEIASTITQAASSVAILGVTFYFNSAIKRIESERRAEENRNGRHDRNQIRLVYLKQLSTFINEIEIKKNILKSDFEHTNENGTIDRLGALILLFRKIEDNYESEDHGDIIDSIKQITEEKTYTQKKEANKLLKEKESIRNIVNDIYTDFIVDLKVQTLINPESFKESLHELDNLLKQDRDLLESYEELFASLYIHVLKLEKILSKLKNEIETEIENNF